MNEAVTFKIACPNCQGRIEFPKEMHGQTIPCPHCDLTVVLQVLGYESKKIEKPPLLAFRKSTTGQKHGKYSCPKCHSTDTKCERDMGCAIIVIIFISCGLGVIMIPFLPFHCTCLNCKFKWKS